MERAGNRITVNQIKKIHVLAKEHGMDDELLHAYIQTLTKKESLKLLTVSEGIKVIDALEGKAEEPTGQTKASRKQMQYIFGLMKKLGWVTDGGEPDTARLDRFLQSPKAGINLGSYKWLDRAKAGRLIEALKSMSERTHTKNV